MKEKTYETDLPNLFREALKIPSIHNELLRINGITDIEERGYHDYFICLVVKYLTFMETTDGIEQFLNEIDDSRKEEIKKEKELDSFAFKDYLSEKRDVIAKRAENYFKRAIALKKLQIPENEIEGRINEIYQYAIEKSCIYGFHSTMDVNSIIKDGFRRTSKR